jgi:ribosomal protein S18 acetylase RimI-like enzyme
MVALAGYMKKLGSKLLEAYRNKVLNIHPALLPNFGGQGMYGMAVHRAVIASGVSVTGPTVHLVDDEYDRGPILAQTEVPVKKNDTPQSLQKRVLQAEHRIYPATIEAYNSGIIAIYQGTPDTIIRPIGIMKDFQEAARILRSAENESTGRFAPITDGGGVLLGAFGNSQMLGYVAVRELEDETDVWHLGELAVLPRNRRSGLGSLLLDHACRTVIEYGGRRLVLTLMDAESRLKEWYFRRGFEKISADDIDQPNVCRMAKDLKQPGGEE